MAKWGIPVLALVLGFMVGFLLGNGGKTGTEEMNQTNALNSRITALQGELRSNASQMQALTQAKETCEAKFQRSTILYDGILFQGRRWIIPADVEPIYLGQGTQADYTHLDPKTQTETIHMKPKSQQ
jgi:Tfp pilus assembly protein PilN